MLIQNVYKVTQNLNGKKKYNIFLQTDDKLKAETLVMFHFAVMVRVRMSSLERSLHVNTSFF